MSKEMKSEFGKVAVLMGGLSAEREISLLSGTAVFDSLIRSGVDAIPIDVGKDVAVRLNEGNYDRVFNILHGRGGEDGTIQGLLQFIGIKYTGAGVMGSALTMDKLRCKQIWESCDIPTPECFVLDSAEACTSAIQHIGLPLIVKPVLEGSSIGMSKVVHEDELIPAWRKAEECGGVVIAERWITGDEYTVAILGDKALPIIKLETPREFYDYEAKYKSNDTQYICPCGLNDNDEALMAKLMMKAFHRVDGSGWGRVDFMIDEEGLPWLIEVNTVPGMTSHSLVPMAAKQAGIEFDELVLKILRGAHE